MLHAGEVTGTGEQELKKHLTSHLGQGFCPTRRSINMLSVGTLKDGYVCNVPLPRVQRIQSASDYTKTTQSQVDAYEYASGKGTPSPDYLPVSSWIPMLPKLGRLIRFSQRIL